jgi:hypothetical protein
MRENRIAAAARFSSYAPVERFSFALVKRRKRTLIDGLVVLHTIRATSGGFERIKMRRYPL